MEERDQWARALLLAALRLQGAAPVGGKRRA